LAHEIKNPLSTIRLNLELLAENLAQQETHEQRRAQAKVALLQRECQRLEDLLNDFLQFAKDRTLRLEECDLNREVEAVLEFYRPQADEARIELVSFCAADLPLVQLDHEVFRAALFNLILNAQQAMPQGGRLMFRTRAEPPWVGLDLIDTGHGMDEKTLSQIFRAFYSTKTGGSGLGLPTARKIVEAHGGRIRVQSEPNRGTQFTIWLPTGATAVPAPADAASSPPTSDAPRLTP